MSEVLKLGSHGAAVAEAAPPDMTAQFASLAVLQRQLGALLGRPTNAEQQYVLVPKPADYVGPTFVVDCGAKHGRLRLKRRSP